MTTDVPTPSRTSPATPPAPAHHGHDGPSARAPAGSRTRWVVALGLVVAWAVASGVTLPRSPLTTTAALASLGASVAVGLAVGLLTASWRGVVLAPLVFAVVVELVRWPVDGPTLDAPHLSTYGVMALVVGRGVHLLLTLLPMTVAAAWGARTSRARHRPPEGTARLGRRVLAGTFTGLAVLVIGALAVALARPATTSPVVDASGRVPATSIAELTTVDVGDHELGLMIRGHDTANPVVLFLAGGPGGSERGAMRRHLPALEEAFTVATLDQRGTGTSYVELDPTDTYTLESAVDDVLAVTRHLRGRFGQDRVVLVGQSWGSILGALAVQAEPNLFAAFVGVGQMVSPVATDRIFWSDTLAWAEAGGNAELAAALREIGPPPYADVLDYETALSSEHEVYPYDHRGNSEGAGGFSENFLVPEYSLLDQVHLLGGFLDTFAVLYPRIQDVDLRRDAARLDVPVVVVQGAHEARGRTQPFEEWFAALEAPSKEVVVLDRSGHRPMFEQPGPFVEVMVSRVLPLVR